MRRFRNIKINPVNIKLKADAKLHAGRLCNIPKAYEKMDKTVVNRLYTVDVLEKLSHTEDSPWAAPSFCQIKKIGDPRFLTDFREPFREVNKCIQRKPFPLPRLNKSLQKILKLKTLR